MGLNWVRLDTAFPSNPKVLALVEDRQFRAISVYVCGLSYSGAHGTDGFIPMAALPFIHASKRDAEKLVEVSLWHPRMGGWEINDWDEFQPSNEGTQQRKNRARLAAEERWRRAANARE